MIILCRSRISSACSRLRVSTCRFSSGTSRGRRSSCPGPVGLAHTWFVSRPPPSPSSTTHVVPVKIVIETFEFNDITTILSLIIVVIIDTTLTLPQTKPSKHTIFNRRVRSMSPLMSFIFLVCPGTLSSRRISRKPVVFITPVLRLLTLGWT